jgi:hypothetical protein
MKGVHYYALSQVVVGHPFCEFDATFRQAQNADLGFGAQGI